MLRKKKLRLRRLIEFHERGIKSNHFMIRKNYSMTPKELAPYLKMISWHKKELKRLKNGLSPAVSPNKLSKAATRR